MKFHADVFISHSTKDKCVADDVCAVLEKSAASRLFGS